MTIMAKTNITSVKEGPEDGDFTFAIELTGLTSTHEVTRLTITTDSIEETQDGATRMAIFELQNRLYQLAESAAQLNPHPSKHDPYRSNYTPPKEEDIKQTASVSHLAAPDDQGNRIISVTLIGLLASDVPHDIPILIDCKNKSEEEQIAEAENAMIGRLHNLINNLEKPHRKKNRPTPPTT